ncbi:unnamed protein product, partial [Brassica rapa]
DNSTHEYSDFDGGDILGTEVPKTQENEVMYCINLNDDPRPSNEFSHNTIGVNIGRYQQMDEQKLKFLEAMISVSRNNEDIPKELVWNTTKCAQWMGNTAKCSIVEHTTKYTTVGHITDFSTVVHTVKCTIIGGTANYTKMGNTFECLTMGHTTKRLAVGYTIKYSTMGHTTK